MESIDRVPVTVQAAGRWDRIGQRLLGLCCSVACPPELRERAIQAAANLRDAGIAVISGFHSPVEKECLTILLQGQQAVLICPARSIEGMKMRGALEAAMDTGRILILSPFPSQFRRPTAAAAAHRNQFISAAADDFFVPFASPGGKAERLAQDVAVSGKLLFTLDSPLNAGLLALGARRLQEETAAGEIAMARLGH